MVCTGTKIGSAFSKGPFNGNPAAAVFTDENLETDTLMKIAANLNQPITSVIGPQMPSCRQRQSPRSASAGSSLLSARFAICGHGTMVAARTIFERGLGDSVEVVELHTGRGDVMEARKVGKDGIEIRLPAGTLREVSSEESPRIAAAVFKAFGRNVAIKYIGAGGKGFENYVMVELDEQEKSGKERGRCRCPGYTINVITTASSSGEELFVSRMFAPAVIPAASSKIRPILAPKEQALLTDQAFDAKMKTAVIALKGETFVMASGEIYCLKRDKKSGNACTGVVSLKIGRVLDESDWTKCAE
ncbi:phenazine biosynthesis-like protein-domain-containing protein [Mycena olivaceomarginata]|nr:phenazine biosynthesis-like protein-domain-containing protein [Mycena olivaceomarginata]